METRKVLPVITLIIVGLSIAVAYTSTTVMAQENKPLVIAIALGLLGEDPNLNAMMGNITQVRWKVITGDFTYNDIKDAKMIIFVQVDTSYNLSKSDLNAIKQWFDQGGKTLWVTGDSDYSGGDFKRIPVTNSLLEAVGSHLRNDNCEVEDPVSNTGAGYRVAAYVEPDPALAFLKAGVTHRILFHGPGPIAIYYNGKWYPYYNDTKPPLPTILKIAVTSKHATIHEFVKPWPAAYNVLNPPTNSFVLMAAEFFLNKSDIVIFSGEAPFDHYTPMWVNSYKGIPLSGQQFVTNVILWGVGLLGERIPAALTLEKEIETYKAQIAGLQNQINQYKSQISNLQTTVSNLKNQISTLTSERNQYKSKVSQLQSQVSNLQNQVNQYKNKVNSLQTQLNSANSQISNLQKQISNLKGQVSNLTTMQYVWGIIGFIIGIVIGWPVGRKTAKK